MRRTVREEIGVSYLSLTLMPISSFDKQNIDIQMP